MVASEIVKKGNDSNKSFNNIIKSTSSKYRESWFAYVLESYVLKRHIKSNTSSDMQVMSLYFSIGLVFIIGLVGSTISGVTMLGLYLIACAIASMWFIGSLNIRRSIP